MLGSTYTDLGQPDKAVQHPARKRLNNGLTIPTHGLPWEMCSKIKATSTVPLMRCGAHWLSTPPMPELSTPSAFCSSGEAIPSRQNRLLPKAALLRQAEAEEKQKKLQQGAAGVH